jgi:AraC-like DNA-binding protein
MGPSVTLDGRPAPGIEELRSYMLASTVPLELAADADAPRRVTTSATHFGAAILHTTEAQHIAGVRTPRLARDDTLPRLLVAAVVSGTATVRQNGRTAALGAGDVALLSSTASFSSRCAQAHKQVLMLPADELSIPASLIRDSVARRVPARHPLAAVLGPFLGGLAAAAPSLTAPERAAIEAPVTDLVRALVATLGGDENHAVEPLARTLRVRIPAYLERNFASPELTAESVARAHGISERYLYSVLASVGISLGEWVRNRRLAAAAEDLADPGTTVSAIAHRWGFADHAHFSHLFRARYGMTPTDWRQGGTEESSRRSG